MKNRNSVLAVTIAAGLLLAGWSLASCKKYEDPPPTDGTGLTNKYCNDPLASNYNWGFPGEPDSTACIYPVDRFSGTWSFSDTVTLPDSTVVEITTRQLIIAQVANDTTMSKMTVSGMCSNNNTVKITADKYYTALTDTLIEFTNGGQLMCNTMDTVMGSFIKNDTIEQITINLTVNDASGTQYHRGVAIKQ